jgi:hypothetical protein
LAFADEGVEADEKTLQQAKVATDGPGLLAFFRARSPDVARQKELELLIQDLGSDSFPVREHASLELVAAGPPARSYLQQALASADLEMVRRARLCLEEIDRAPGPALSGAAVRLLGLRKPQGAIPALLAYLPFCDDEAVEEEVVQVLSRLAQQAGPIEPTLSAALRDPLRVRRGAAAYALGRVGAVEHQALVRALLADTDPRVRLRAAQGLVAGKDKTAVPVLIALMEEAPLPVSSQAEELLFRIAADKAPSVSVGQGDAGARKQCRAAWTGWWRDHGPAVDLTRFEEAEQPMGVTVIAELDSNKVWECGPDGKPHWQLTGLMGPIDAQVLPGGRVLIAENRSQRITERDLSGKILWQQTVPSNPICCQRLPNGNTFVATYQGVMEFTRDNKEVYSHHPIAAPFIFGAQKLRNGHIVFISAQNTLVEMEPNGKEIRRVPVTTNGNWCGVEALPGGHYLVALMWNGKVAELDTGGREVRAITVPGACSATRLPNGNPLIACMGSNRVVEYDWTGKKIREIPTAGRPFHAHRR